MINAEELSGLDAMAMAELVKRKKAKPIEPVEAAIARMEKLNPQINAVITPMYDMPREAAVSKLPNGPFKGVPFLLKDLVAEYAGARFAEGANQWPSARCLRRLCTFLERVANGRPCPTISGARVRCINIFWSGSDKGFLSGSGAKGWQNAMIWRESPGSGRV